MIRMSPARVLACAFPFATLALIQPAAAETYYLYGDVGESSDITFAASPGNGESHNGARFGFGAGVTFQSGIGVELSKNKLGESFSAFQTIPTDPSTLNRNFTEFDSLGLFATYRYQPKPQGILAGARLGIHHWNGTLTFDNPNHTDIYSFQRTGEDLAAGLELGYRWHQQWSTAVTWTRYLVDDSDSDHVALRLSYHF